MGFKLILFFETFNNGYVVKNTKACVIYCMPTQRLGRDKLCPLGVIYCCTRVSVSAHINPRYPAIRCPGDTTSSGSINLFLRFRFSLSSPFLLGFAF